MEKEAEQKERVKGDLKRKYGKGGKWKSRAKGRDMKKGGER